MVALGELAEFVVGHGSWPTAVFGDVSASDLGGLVMLAYFRGLKSWTHDKATIASVAQRFVDDALSASYSGTSIYLLTGFRATEPFRIEPNLDFRPIGFPEFEAFGRVEPEARLGFDRPWLNSRDWICEIVEESHKTSFDAVYRHHDAVDDILGALNITAPGRSGLRLLESRGTSPFYSTGTTRGGATYFSSGISGDELVLDHTGIRSFIENYGIVRAIRTSDQLKKLQLPLRRLRAASSRKDDEDKVVDWVVGLERLLAPDSDHLEVTYRFRLRGAAILPESFGTPKERKQFMGNIYKLRSDIVHGKVKQNALSTMAPQVERAFAAILLWFAKVQGQGHKDLMAKLDDVAISGGATWVTKMTQPT